jgi:sarcosine oxidase subunit beta
VSQVTPERFDIAVIGAGVVGCSVAWHLAASGETSVIVIDKAPEPGCGSTAKATGGYRAQFADETNIRLSLLSRDKLRRFSRDTGGDCGYAPHGYLFLATSEEEIDTLKAAQNLQHACGLREARMLTASEARALNPAIGDPSITGAAFCPTDGFIKPLSILNGYADAARRLGVRFQFGTEVTSLARENGRAVAALTPHGEIRANVFVNAMGAWAGEPVKAVRRNVLATAATSLLTETTPMTIWAGDWFHLRVREGRVLLLWPDDPVCDDEEWVRIVLDMARRRVPALAALPIEEQWSGFYEMSPDERALLGLAPGWTNLYLATGSSGHGVMHAPALGQLLAETILTGRTSIDVSALDPARFVLA